MTTEQAWLGAIRANPTDDTVRLVYCDFLEERDGPGDRERAEFIRQQIADPFGGQYSATPALIRQHRPHVHVGDDWPDMTCVVRRGFVAEVYCTLAEWCGVGCPRCERSGRQPSYDDDGTPDPFTVPCVWCNGAGGLTPGFGRRVLAAHPVQRVVATDAHPAAGDGGWWWGCGVRVGAADRAILPPEVWELIHDHRRHQSGRFPSVAEAVAALSAALIAWARGGLAA